MFDLENNRKLEISVVFQIEFYPNSRVLILASRHLVLDNSSARAAALGLFPGVRENKLRVKQVSISYFHIFLTQATHVLVPPPDADYHNQSSSSAVPSPLCLQHSEGFRGKNSFSDAHVDDRVSPRFVQRSKSLSNQEQFHQTRAPEHSVRILRTVATSGWQPRSNFPFVHDSDSRQWDVEPPPPLVH